MGGFMGSDELLELVTCGDSEVGLVVLVGVEPPCGEGVGFCEELLRFDPTRFLKRVFMEFISQGARWAGDMGGVLAGKLKELLRLTDALGCGHYAYAYFRLRLRQPRPARLCYKR